MFGDDLDSPEELEYLLNCLKDKFSISNEAKLNSSLTLINRISPRGKSSFFPKRRFSEEGEQQDLNNNSNDLTD